MNHYRQTEKAMHDATSYEEWYAAALELDRLEGRDQWRLVKESERYDFRLIASRVSVLRELRKRQDYDRLMFRLREELHGNLGNMANPELYQQARGGTKKLINQYLDEVSMSQLDTIFVMELSLIFCLLIVGDAIFRPLDRLSRCSADGAPRLVHARP